MAGIKNIRDLYKKFGEKGLREVLKRETRITEKFDAFRFAIEKNQYDYRVYFYGKNGKIPLNKIDRTINDLYENAISYIENLPKDILKSIPVRHRFGFSWFPERSPLETNYERRPKNGLILTDITIRNQDSEVARDVTDTTVMERWSHIFNCECNKPLFEGVFTEEVIDSLVELAKNEEVKQINESLFPTKGFLNYENQSIDAFIFEQDDILFKVSNIESVEQKNQRSHLFDILLLDICEHINSCNLLQIKPDVKNSDEAYIEIVSEIFNSFVNKKGDEFLRSELDRPIFLEKSGDFNNSWIYNRKTRAIIESNSRYEYLFTVFLANLRKPKYPSGLLSENVVKDFNNKIEEICKLVANDYSFLEFNFIINEEEKEEKEKEKPKKEKKKKSPDVEKAVLLLDAFFNNERKFDKKEKINILICNCSIFTNKLLEYAESIVKLTDVKILLVHDPKQDFLNVDDTEVKRYLSEITKKYDKLFVDYRILKIPSLSYLFKISEKYNPKKIYVSESIYDITKMETDSIYATRCYQGPEWEVKKMPTNLYKKTIETLEKNSEIDFKSNTPVELHGYWYLLKNLFDKHFYI